MTYGLYISYWTTIDPAKFAVSSNGLDLDFAIIRARGAGYDDPKITQHRRWAESQKVNAGALIFGYDMYLGYAPGTPSGQKQAADFWELINRGGKTWEIVPEIDVEHQPKEYDQNGRVKSYWPVPSDFLTVWLEPAVKYLQDRMGRSPMIYCSPWIIKDWFSGGGTKTPPDWLLQCPLHIANYQVETPSISYWPYWVFWQKTNTQNWPGASSICIEQFNGSRAELKAFCRDANWRPGMTPQPQPEPQPGTQPEPDFEQNIDLSEINAKLDEILQHMERLKWLER